MFFFERIHEGTAPFGNKKRTCLAVGGTSKQNNRNRIKKKGTGFIKHFLLSWVPKVFFQTN